MSAITILAALGVSRKRVTFEMQLSVVVANIGRHLAIRDSDIWVAVAVQISNCRIPCWPFRIAVGATHPEVANAVVD